MARGKGTETTTVKPVTAEVPRIPARCPAGDGGILNEKGYCAIGRGYFSQMSCPFACPRCRQTLDWDGGCSHCHGCTTADRDDWTFPGDRYEFTDAHWRRVLTGPRKACDAAENTEAAGIVSRILGSRLHIPFEPRRP